MSEEGTVVSKVSEDSWLDGVVDGWLYYTDSDLYKIRLDGTQKTKVVDVTNNLHAVIDNVYNDKLRIRAYSNGGGQTFYLYDPKTKKAKAVTPKAIQ